MPKRTYTPEQKAAQKARAAEYYQRNKEKIRERQNAQRKANPERRAEIAKASKQKHKDKVRAAGRAYYEANKEHIGQRIATYRKNNLDAHKARTMAYREKNREKMRQYRRAHYLANREHCLALDAIYRKEHHEEKLAYRRRRRAESPQVRIGLALRTRTGMALKKGYKAGSAVRDLGCTIDELIGHLEAQFLPGMSWENYGRSGWHIDHIVPLDAFDLTDRAQFLRACHFENLRPLWAKDNLSKGSRVVSTPRADCDGSENSTAP